MTDVNNKAIAGRSLAEWKKLARQDDCFDCMVPSDLRCILAAIEAPDHLALVAAAYREVVRNILGVTILVAPDGISHREGAESVRRQLAGFIETLTPADAEARLTALLRAEYERGVRDAAKACDWGDIYGDNAVRSILALLTQEGR